MEKPKGPKAAKKVEPKPIAKVEVAYPSNPLQLVKPAWQALLLNWRVTLAAGCLTILAGLAVALVVILIATASNLQNVCSGSACSLGAAAPVIIGSIVALGLAAIYLGPIWIRLTLAMARQQKLKLDDLLQFQWRTGWRLLLTSLLLSIIVAVGFILFIVPGILALLWLAFACYVVVDENLTPVDALYRSRELVRGRVMEVGGLLGLYLTADLLNLLPFIGRVLNLVAGTLLVIMMAMRYTTMRDLQENPPAEPVPVATSNYVWFYCGIAVMVLLAAAIIFVVAAFSQTAP